MNKKRCRTFLFLFAVFPRNATAESLEKEEKQAKTGKSVIVPRHLLHHLLHLKITLNYYEYQYVICSVIDVIDKRNETII